MGRIIMSTINNVGGNFLAELKNRCIELERDIEEQIKYIEIKQKSQEN
jgi:hypothetical protein